MKKITIGFLGCAWLILAPIIKGEMPEPVTPNASAQARALLQLFYDISGKYTLTGQHNYPNTRDRNSQFAAEYIGAMPAIWSTDMGFAGAGDTDSYLARRDIVDEAIRQHRMGSIITICWHAVPPTADEPVTFRPRPGASPEKLESVQGQLLDRQFRDILTPGTVLYKKWAAQVDSVAFYLKKLRDAGVPVLWRPYHEMNGDWFWWGGRRGKYGSRDLYKQLFDRYTRVHKLNNLIWLWSVDRAHQPKMYYSAYCPGSRYFDMVSLDVYGSDFNQAYYDTLAALSEGKPMVLGEVGNPPSPAILEQQPRWTYWVVWAGMVRNTPRKVWESLLAYPRILTLDTPAYWEVTASYRQVCGMPPLPLRGDRPNFTGEWLLNEEKSIADQFGFSNCAYRLEIEEKGTLLNCRRHFIVEWADDRIVEQSLVLDGSEVVEERENGRRTTKAKWNPEKGFLEITSADILIRDNRSTTWQTTEKWQLKKRGRELHIEQTMSGFREPRTLMLIYDRK